MSCNLATHSDNRFCCARCSRAFSSMEPFDWHRQGICVDPGTALHEKTGLPRFITRDAKGLDGNPVPVWGLNAVFAKKRRPARGTPSADPRRAAQPEADRT